MVLSAKSRYTYVPVFNGNRELPERERVTVEIIRPKAEERKELFSTDYAREAGLVGEDKLRTGLSLTLKVRYRTGRILREHVGEIKNLAVEEDGLTRPVVNGAALAGSTAFGVVDLIEELIAEVLTDMLAEDEKKSLPLPSSLSAKDGPGNNGTPSTTKSGKSSASDSSSGENLQAT